MDRLPAPPSTLVFIMGCHRSGTSMLYHLLAHAGQLDYLSAYDIIKYDELLHNSATGRAAQVKAELQLTLQQEPTRGLDDLPVGVDLPEEYRFVMPQDDPGIVLNFKKRLDQLFFAPHLTAATLDHFLTVCRKKRLLLDGIDRPLLLKNPADHYFNFWEVHRLLPQAKFIFIHRHPLTMFNSFLNGFPAILMQRSNYAALIDPRYDKLFGRLPLRRKLFLSALRSEPMCRLLMGRFVESFRYYLDHVARLPAEQSVTIRYEDLCADPAGCLSGIAARLQLAFIPRIPHRFVAPRHLPVIERVTRHYAARSGDIAPYLEHCRYPIWPEPDIAVAADHDRPWHRDKPNDDARVGAAPA